MSEATASVARRLAILDVARGVAILAMATYHTAWDLQFLQLAAVDAAGAPGWRAFAQAIAATFLVIVGVSLVLANRKGVVVGPFARRLALVAGAAALITVATAIATPDRFIFFGILHCIAASSVLALPFLRAPVAVIAATAVFVILLPQLYQASSFDHPGLVWLGLGAERPATNDFVPIFPWFGPVLVGILLGRLAVRQPEHSWWRTWRAKRMPARLLALAGRHSLPIYLVHQPLIMAALWLLLQVTGPNPAAGTASFMRACVPACLDFDGDEKLCRASCTCTADALRRAGLLGRARPAVGGADDARVAALARQCQKVP